MDKEVLAAAARRWTDTAKGPLQDIYEHHGFEVTGAGDFHPDYGLRTCTKIPS